MATLELNVTTNAPSVLSGVDASIGRTISQAERLQSSFSTIRMPNMAVDAGSGWTSAIAMGNLYASAIKGAMESVVKYSVAAWDSFTQVNSQFEQSRIKLGTITGSIEGGKQAFSEMIALSEKAPFSVNVLTDSFMRLKSAGIQDTTNQVRILADAVAASGGGSQQLELVAIAIQQIAGKGKLAMEELRRQLSQQIPQAIALLEEKLKGSGALKDGENIFDVMSKKGIGAKTALTAIMASFDENFGGSAAARMKSFQGATMLLSNQWKLFLDDVGNGTGAFQSISEAIAAAAEMIKKFRTSAEGQEIIAKTGEAIAAAFKKITDNPEVVYAYFSTFASAVGTVIEALKIALNLSNRLLSSFDLAKSLTPGVEGGVSAYAFSKLPKDYSMDNYARDRPALEEITKLNAAGGPTYDGIGDWLQNKPSGDTRDLSKINELIDGLGKTKNLLGDVKNEGKAATTATMSVADAYSKIRDDSKGPKTGINKEDRLALAATTQEIKNYTNAAEDAAKASEKWVSAGKKAIKDMKDIQEEYTTIGMSSEQTSAYKDDKEFEEARKKAMAYATQMEEIEGKIKAVTAARIAATEGLAKIQGELSKNPIVSDDIGDNKAHKLSQDVKRLTEDERKLLAIQIQLAENPGLSVDDIDDLKAKRQLIESMEKAYSLVGAGSKQVYDHMKEMYEADRDAFIEKGLDKVTAQEMFNENMRKLNETAATDWQVGVKDGLDGFAAESLKMNGEIAGGVKSAFKGMGDALAEFVVKGKTDISSLVDSILADFTRIVIQQNITGPMAGVMGGLFQGFMASAQGNVFSGPGISAYSNTIVSSPTVFPFAQGIGLMGEAGDEAIMPLKRMSGGDLGIKAETSKPNMTVNVSTPPGTKTEVKQSDDGLSMDILIEQVDNMLAQRASRGKSALGSYLGGRR